MSAFVTGRWNKSARTQAHRPFSPILLLFQMYPMLCVKKEMTTRTHIAIPLVLHKRVYLKKKTTLSMELLLNESVIAVRFFLRWAKNENGKKKRRGFSATNDTFDIRHLTPSWIRLNQQSMAPISAPFQYHTHWLRLRMSLAIRIHTPFDRLTMGLNRFHTKTNACNHIKYAAKSKGICVTCRQLSTTYRLAGRYSSMDVRRDRKQITMAKYWQI